MIVRKFDLGFRDQITFRPDTSDAEIIRNILIDRKEYSLFVGCKPKIIFDVGANIGATSVLFANAYPDASIYAFEPEPENYKLLEINTKAYPRVKTFPMGLGAHTGQRELLHSENPLNKGGFSVHTLGVDPNEESQTISIADVREILKVQMIPKVDLLKVDTEGCEFEIINAFGDSLPPFIMGEAHGIDDWKLFDLLSRTHDLQITKEFTQRCFPFYALRKPYVAN